MGAIVERGGARSRLAALDSPRFVRHFLATSEAQPQSEALLGWEDFIALPDEDRRELLDGVLLDPDMPTEIHEHIVAALGFHLGLWAREHGARLLASGYKVRVGKRRGFMPDLQLYRAENPARRGSQGLDEGHPDLVVEIISPLALSERQEERAPTSGWAEPRARSGSSARYDRLVKLNGYAALGVPEYWLIDPELQTIERFVLRDGLYAVAQNASENEVFEPASYSGVSVPLAELWVTA